MAEKTTMHMPRPFSMSKGPMPDLPGMPGKADMTMMGSSESKDGRSLMVGKHMKGSYSGMAPSMPARPRDR